MNHPVRDWAEEFLLEPAWNWTSWLKSSWSKSKRVQRIVITAVAGAFVLLAIIGELRTSWLESLIFRSLDRKITFQLEQGPSQEIQYPKPGPYDWTLGYARMPDFLPHLEAHGFRITAQAHSSGLLTSLSGLGRGVPGLSTKGPSRAPHRRSGGARLYSFDRPRHVYPSYSSIPPLVVQTLLFIENRHMLDPEHPTATRPWNGIGWQKRCWTTACTKWTPNTR